MYCLHSEAKKKKKKKKKRKKKKNSRFVISTSNMLITSFLSMMYILEFQHLRCLHLVFIATCLSDPQIVVCRLLVSRSRTHQVSKNSRE
ncbi:hypothetical protein HanIR_Chr17g0877381 [Helianthus annuus]|nr:hypothetical protein HanIR_Chr17g0877381 [Helianthus annuus]